MKVPIQIFSVAEFMNPNEFFRQLRPIFHRLTPDFYDVRKAHVGVLQRSFVRPAVADLRRYYETGEGLSSLQTSISGLSAEEKSGLQNVLPCRYRGCANLRIAFSNGQFQIQREPMPTFSQEEAKIAEEGIDVRQWRRVFAELPQEVTEGSAFTTVLRGIASKIHGFLSGIQALRVVVHFVKVIAIRGQVSTNAPEGVHQDGFPLIVSALVVERRNIEGAESRIYWDNKGEDPLLTAQLQPGTGLLQMDLDSPLWHTVTPLVGKKKEAYRTSIGLDIEPIWSGS